MAVKAVLDFSGVVTDTIEVVSAKTGEKFILRDDIPVEVYLAMIESQIRNEELKTAATETPVERAKRLQHDLEETLGFVRQIFENNGYKFTDDEVRRHFDMKDQQRLLNIFFTSPTRGSSGTALLLMPQVGDAAQ